MAKENDPRRIERLARIRWVYEHLQAWEALVFATVSGSRAQTW